MSGTLVFLQHNEGKLAKAALVSIEAARKLGQGAAMHGLCLGASAAKAAEAALEYGLEKVLYSEAEAFAKYTADAYTAAVSQALEQLGCDTLVGGATSTVKDFFPRVAAKIDAGQLSDVLQINGDGTFRRPMYAGNILADVECSSAKKVITLRVSSFSPAEKSAAKGKAESLDVPNLNLRAEVLGYEVSAAERPELGDAEIVVSGGRALASAENFEKYIFPLADALGAAVGASRAAVDSGYAPNDWQVGQTGKVVAPALYVAVGISGAIQHLAGMKDSKLIVAINKDAEAPIYEVADYGLVADLYQAVPELTEAIKKAKAG